VERWLSDRHDRNGASGENMEVGEIMMYQ